MYEELEDRLRRLGERLGLEDLRWDEGGECTVEIDGRLVVAMYLDDNEQDLVFYSVVGAFDDSVAPAVYPELVEANLLWKDTGGATLGADPGAGTVILARRFPLEVLGIDAWERHLGAFVSVAESWTERLAELVETAGSAGPPDDGGSSARIPSIRA